MAGREKKNKKKLDTYKVLLIYLVMVKLNNKMKDIKMNTNKTQDDKKIIRQLNSRKVKTQFTSTVRVNLHISLNQLINEVEGYSRCSTKWVDDIHFTEEETIENPRHIDSKIAIKFNTEVGIFGYERTLRDVYNAIKKIVCKSTAHKYNISESTRMRILNGFNQSSALFNTSLLNSHTNDLIMQVATFNQLSKIS